MMSKLKNRRVVSFVLNNFTNDSRVLKESISLQKAGYDVKVIALHEDDLAEFDTIQGIDVHRIRLKSRNWSKYKLIQLFKYFEFIYRSIKYYKKSEILHCNDLNTLPIGVIIKKFFNKKVKIVYDAHEFAINDTPYENRYKIKMKYFLEKQCIKFVDSMITVSDTIAEEYVKLYGIQKPVLVLNTPPYKVIEKKNIFRENFPIDDEQVIFLYQGALSKGRGIETILETCTTLDSQVVIIFIGYGPLTSEIRSIAKKHENIFWHPAVSPDVLLEYTSSADIGISLIEDSCLSYRYCLPNKMFEYIMVGIPVIVSNLIEMKKVVEDYRVGFVVKDNSTKGLKQIINKALSMNQYISQDQFYKAQKIYNWENQEKRLLEVYCAL